MPNTNDGMTDEDEKDDIPDDFFNDLADSKYLDELLSNQVESREPDSTGQNDNLSDMDVEEEAEREGTPDPSMSDKESRSSPLMERCLMEIDKLTKDIQRKKKKLQKELEEKERENNKDRSGSPMPDDNKARRRHRSRSNDRYSSRMHGGRSSSRRKSRSPQRRRSRSHDRRRSRSRSRQRWTSRRSRSPMRSRQVGGSPQPSSSKQMSFLEELDKKFAEQGKAFPEKDLMLQMKASNELLPGTSSSVGHRPNIPLCVAQPIHQYPPQQQQQQQRIEMMQQYPAPHVGPPVNIYPHGALQTDPASYGYQNPNFMPNPIAFQQMAGFVPLPQFNIEPTPVPPPQPAIGQIRPVPVLKDINQQLQINPMAVKARTTKTADGVPPPPTVIKQATSKAQILSRCVDAIKLLRAEENNVPKQRFIFTRTSLSNVSPNDNSTSSPLHSNNNVEFEKTSKTNVAHNPLTGLTGHTKNICKILGFNSNFIFSKKRMRQMASKVIHEIDAKKEEIKKQEKSKIADSFTQTGDYKCPTCLINDEKKYATVGTQKSVERKLSVRTQTDEEDYRHPLIQTLARMKAAQLIAMADFAKLIALDRPTTTNEMFQLRERLMDIYNLGQRDADAVKEAERKRLMENRAAAMDDGRGGSGMPGGPFNSNNMGRGGSVGGGSGGMGMSGMNLNEIASIAMNMGNLNEMANIMANVNSMNNCLPSPQMNNNVNNNNMMRGGGVDYRMDDDEQAAMRRAEQIEQEREMRYQQQMRYEEERRNNELEEERRVREMQMQNNNQGQNNNRGGGGGNRWQRGGFPKNNRFRGKSSPWAR